MSTYQKTTLEKIEFRTPKLSVSNLPLVIDDWTLAFHLGFTGKALWFTIKDRNKLYKVFKIKKASGGMRTIHNPRPIMRLMAKQMRTRILLPLCTELGPHVSAYQIGKSTKDAAARHLATCEFCDKLDQPHTCESDLIPKDGSFIFGYQVTRKNAELCVACHTPEKHTCPRRGVKIHMDLRDFFGSTRRAWIRKYFHEVVGYNHYVSSLMADLLTVTFQGKRGVKYEGVPQGSLTSGDICNLVADWKLDTPILKEMTGWTYSRYADDLYFSHPENLSRAETDSAIKKIERIIAEAGYRVNRKKLHVQRPSKRQKILGIVLNQKVNMPREEYRKFRSLLHNCVKTGFEAQVSRAKKQTIHELHGWIAGKLAYFGMIAPDKAKRLKLVYDYAKAMHIKEPQEVYYFTQPINGAA